MNNESNFEFGDGEFESENYKSCFARSVAVNSDFRLKKITSNLDYKKVQSNQENGPKGAIPKMGDTQGHACVRMRKVSDKLFFNIGHPKQPHCSMCPFDTY